jgi:hypothetical protein
LAAQVADVSVDEFEPVLRLFHCCAAAGPEENGALRELLCGEMSPLLARVLGALLASLQVLPLPPLVWAGVCVCWWCTCAAMERAGRRWSMLAPLETRACSAWAPAGKLPGPASIVSCPDIISCVRCAGVVALAAAQYKSRWNQHARTTLLLPWGAS